MASLRNKKIVLTPGQQYDFPINGDSIRLASANVPIYFKTRDGDLDFYLEQGEKATFAGQDFLTLTIYHLDASDQAVIISVGKDADVGSARFSGNVSISNAVDLSASTLAALENTTIQNLGASYNGNYANNTALGVNGTVQVFSAASNVNGAIIHSAQFQSIAAGNQTAAFIAKATAPANILDGQVILSVDNWTALGGNTYVAGSLKNPIRIPAGLGLHYLITGSEGTGFRTCLYRLL